jgi:hypothetical protein
MKLDKAQFDKPIVTQDDFLQALKLKFRLERRLALACWLMGLLFVLGSAYEGLPAWLSDIGFGLIGLGWVLFIYVLVRRSAWSKQNRVKG